MRSLLFAAAFCLLAVGCNKDKASASAPAPAAGRAELESRAPDFELPDLNGKTVKLSSFAGKTVVLEWFNPGCPFVRMSHTKGSLKDMGNRWSASGKVVWLAINSGAPGKQGHGVEANKAGVQRYGMKYPVLLDESGKVGHMYGASNTPHMFVIDPKGVLVYSGAIDNSPDGEGESPVDGKLVNYVEEALKAVEAGNKPTPALTEAYGCTVKYGS